MSTIIYTQTDEAPALATYSLLPIVQAFTAPAGVTFQTRDISLASRILAHFPEHLNKKQRVDDALAELGQLAQKPEANIVKLPNISASVPQLKTAIAELQAQGFAIPDYPSAPQTPAQKATLARYNKVKGSAVNPVLREGNSDRRAPKAVKEFARRNPHSMGVWSADSKSHVSTMSNGDFFANERSVTIQKATTAQIQHVDASGAITVLKSALPLIEGEVLDATFISKSALVDFLKAQINDAREQGLLFSLHMKATMMKVSDPIIFGHGVRAYFSDLFDAHGGLFDTLGVNVNNGFGDLLAKVQTLPADQRAPIEAQIAATYKKGPGVAMVNSDKGITNLHVPSDVIVDASMPAMIRTSGCMWNAEGQLQQTKAVIPDSCYAGVYQAVFDFCKAHGAFDPTTMGSVSNVGLMAQKAEEYGSHDKTFEVHADGQIQIVDADGGVILSHSVQEGDIWRACQAKDAPIKDWVKLAVSRARATGVPTVFWLDKNRAHDAQLIAKVNTYLGQHDTSGLDIQILDPVAATNFTLERVKQGLNTVSVTGNVLRDYLTDLFPILELGTSAKMLSIVPLMKGGGLFETGAGGSAPKHRQQFDQEGHLRWDSLGEFLAIAVSLDHLGQRDGNPKAQQIGVCLDIATTEYLLNNKSPSRKVNELDNRGSHFYLAMYWAKALATQTEDAELSDQFKPVFEALSSNEQTIVKQLNDAQGSPVDLGGYYWFNTDLATAAMRPSPVFNGIIASI